MLTQPRWIVTTLWVIGGLGLAAAAGLALTHSSGRLSYTVPPGHSQNALTLRVSGPTLELLDGATQAVLESRPLAGTQGVTIQGAPGNVDDALTVDLSGGALALPDGIHFDGGAGGWDTLVVTGGEAATGSYTATGPGSGVVTHAGTRVFFSNLEPVTDTSLMTDYLVLGTSGNDSINVVDGPSCGVGCQTIQVNSPSFESIDFANKNNVTVAGLSGADTFAITTTVPAKGLHKLIVDPGGNPGDVIGIGSFAFPGGTLVLTDALTVTQSGPITVNNLALDAAGPVGLGGSINQVNTLAGQALTANPNLFIFVCYVPTLTVGTVEGLSGIRTANGPTLIENSLSGGAVVVNNALSDPGNKITLFADHITLNAAVNAGSGLVTLDNSSLTEPIVLGAKSPTTLGLLQTDLNHVIAGELRIGDSLADSGGLTVTAAIAAPSGWSTLSLRQNAGITEVPSGRLTVPNLAVVTSGDKVSMSFSPNHVNTLAGDTSGGDFNYADAGHFTIGAVGPLLGLNTGGGAIDLSAAKGGLTVQQDVLSGAGGIFLQASESASAADDLIVDPGVAVDSTASDIVLSAGDHLSLGTGSTVKTAGGGHILLAFSQSDTDNLGGATLGGTVSTSSHTPQATGGNADDTLLIDFQAGAALPISLSYDGGNGLNTLTFSDAGGSNPHTYHESGTSMTRDVANLVFASQVQVMTAIGGSAPDIFQVIPNAGSVMHAIGGLPGHPAGDILLIEPVGATTPALHVTGFDASGETGQWTFGNRQPVDFTGIDTYANLTQQSELPLVQK